MILVLAVYSTSTAQVFRIGPSVGVSTIQNSGIFATEYPDLESDIFYGLKAKLDLPAIPLNFIGKINYVEFTSDNDIVQSSLLTLGVGAEYTIIPGYIQPYLAFDLLYSSFSNNKIKIEETTFSAEDFSRTGIGIGAGIDFQLLPSIDIDASVKYNFNNMLGKDDSEEGLNTVNITVSALLKL